MAQPLHHTGRPGAARPGRRIALAAAASAAAAAALLISAGPAAAQTTTWQAPAPNGDFADPANWSAGVPGPGFAAVFGPASSANSGSIVVRSAVPADAAADGITFTFQDNFNPTNTALFGNDAAADTAIRLGGGLAAGSTLIDVQAAGGSVTFQPKNPQAQAAPANLSLTLVQSGGFNVATGGRLAVTSLIAGTGTGTATTALTKTGGGTLVLGFGVNTFRGLTISGGVVEAVGTNFNTLGILAGGLTLDGGTFRNSTTSTATSRALTITGNHGTVDVPAAANSFSFTGNVAGPGRLTKTGPGTLTFNPGTGVTYTYQGGLAVLGGTFSASGATQLGTLPASAVADYLLLDGGALRWTGASVTLGTARGTTIGDGGATFDVSTAATTLRFDGVVTSPAAATTAGVTKAGPGTLRLTANNPYRGNTTINAGTLMVSQGASLGSAAVPTTVTINNGGTLAYNTTAVAVAFATSRTLALDAGAVVEVTTGSARMAVGGPVADKPGVVGSLTKTGGGVLVLSGTGAFAPTYTGATTVSAGTLLFNTAKTVAGPVGVAAGGALGGTGSVNMGANTMSILGTLSPGDSSGAPGAAVIETLEVAGNVALTDGAASGTLAVDVDAAAAGRQVDLLTVTGNLNLTGATLSVQGLAPIVDGSTRAYVFATYGTLTGTFAAFATPLGAGDYIDYAYQGTNQIALVVPDPATAGLLAAVAGVALARRRRRRA